MQAIEYLAKAKPTGRSVVDGDSRQPGGRRLDFADDADVARGRHQVERGKAAQDVRQPGERPANHAALLHPLVAGAAERDQVLQAVGLQVAVVFATPVAKGAEGLDVVDGEHLLLADDAEDFARCTVELLGNADLRSLLAANARQLVEERYDWSTIGARFVSLVEGAVGRHA